MVSYELVQEARAEAKLMLDKWVAAEARAARYRKALEEIAAKRCGVYGHSVAVDCGASALARHALAEPPTEEEK